ncbi:MAG: hypothetical protein CVU93_02765, partial [Firmicutes bacterium HGW-Firmicutes-18]
SRSDDYNFPDWKGMRFELVSLEIPVKGSVHLSLRLENREHKDVFASLCADLADDLSEVSGNRRDAALASFLDRWTKFFERFGVKGLSPEKQRGMYGELCWLRSLMVNDISYITALNAWKGCERGYHDFEINGQVVEVKTTMTKEPRKVRISNERQLDDRGLLSLHLFVLTLIKSEGGGESLPEIVDSIMAAVSTVPGGRRRFEQCLIAAGYLEIHTHLYPNNYTVKRDELFRVEEGFPRITDVPDGLGDIKYSLVVGAVSDFLSDKDEYLAMLKGAKK